MNELTPAPFRAPPQNLEAERSLLGALLMNNRAYERVSDFLLPEHFTDPINARVYEACTRLIEQGRQANPVTLKSYLEHDETIIAAGGIKYLTTLATSVVTIINAGDYGKLIYDLYLRRELIDAGQDLVNAALDVQPDQTATDLIEAQEARLFQLTRARSEEDRMVQAGRAMDEAFEQIHAIRHGLQTTGVPLSLRNFNQALGGLRATDLIYLAARPSMGKSALAGQIGLETAIWAKEQDENRAPDADQPLRGLTVLFSLEMSRDQVAVRWACQKDALSAERARLGKIDMVEYQAFADARTALADLPLHIDDQAALTTTGLRTKLRRLARKQPLCLVIIDYLQLLRSTKAQKSDNRSNEIGMISRDLKALAKEFKCPFLVLSQLSRAVEQRQDKRPLLSDLRESGNIEQDADQVVFIYRPGYYVGQQRPTRRAEEGDDQFTIRQSNWAALAESTAGQAEIIVGKNRHGRVGTFDATWDAETLRFLNRTPDLPYG